MLFDENGRYVAHVSFQAAHFSGRTFLHLLIKYPQAYVAMKEVKEMGWTIQCPD